MRQPRKIAGVFLLAFALSPIPTAAWAMKAPTVSERKAAISRPPADEEPALSPSGDPVVKITPPPEDIARKIIYFPLELPAWILRVATLPVGMLFNVIDKYDVVERAADLLSNKDKTIWAYPIIEGGAGSGFGGGAGLNAVDIFGMGINTKFTYTNHIDLSQRATAAIGKPEALSLAGRPISLAGRVAWARPTNVAYYGIGPDTVKSMNGAYMDNRTVLSAGAAWEVLKGFSINAGLAYDVATSGQNTYGGGPAVDAVFPAGEIEGFGRWIHYLVPALTLQFDTRDNVSLPTRGGIYSASFYRYQSLGSGSYSFNQFELDARHFISLRRPRTVIALHAGLIVQQNSGDNSIPFYRLATLDAGSPLRGFTTGRFHDKSLVVLNAEYRFPVWNSIDGVLFIDTGRVFRGFQNFALQDFKYSGGGGLRIRAMGIMLLRFDLAYGGEGVQALVGISKSL